MPCLKCRNTPPEQDGYCDGCRQAVLGKLRTACGNFGDHMIGWMKQAESRHGSTLFYSDEAIGSGNQQAESNAQSGVACGGFAVSGKVFTKNEKTSSAKAVRAFIEGGVTVCECEGLLHAVAFNALLETMGETLFDHVFPKIVLGTAKGCSAIKLFKEIAFTDPAEICPGDWVYVLTKDRSAFTGAVGESGQGAAGGGWNLVSTGGGRYIGFGINPTKGKTDDFTLDEISGFIATAATGGTVTANPSKPGKLSLDELFPPKPKQTTTTNTVPTSCPPRRGSGGFTMPSPVGDMDRHQKLSSDIGSGKTFANSKATMVGIKDSVQITFVKRLDVEAVMDWVGTRM